jgi:hypothetical protein
MELIVFLSVVTLIAAAVAIWGLIQLKKEAKTTH